MGKGLVSNVKANIYYMDVVTVTMDNAT